MEDVYPHAVAGEETAEQEVVAPHSGARSLSEVRLNWRTYKSNKTLLNAGHRKSSV